jgi:PAS domain S-box-containing protein
MASNPFLIPQGDPAQAYAELDYITKMLLKRDVQLTDLNIELERKNRDLELARQELLHLGLYMANLISNSPDAIWALDNDQHINTFNKVAEEITGYRMEEVLGRPVDFLFITPESYLDLLTAMPLQGGLRNIRSRLRRKDGEVVEILMSVSLLIQQGQPGSQGSMTIFKDITREIRLEEALREANERLEEKVRQRTTELEELSQTLLMLNHVSSVASQSLELDTLLNNILRSVLELTGYNMGIISPLLTSDILTVRAQLKMPEPLLAKLKEVPKGEGIIGRAASSGFLQSAGPDLPEMVDADIRLVVAVPLRAKGTIQGVMTLFSQSEREVSDQEWDIFMAIGVQAGWAIENAWLYEQVKTDVEKLKEVDRIKTEFIATISHELRTPLTSIIGFLSYANIAMEKHEQKKLQRYITIALENGQKLAQMIEDLLAMQKLDAGSFSLHYETFPLNDLLDEIGVDLGPQLNSKEQKLILVEGAKLPPLEADREQLERALTNLVINAIKFTDGPGTITLKAVHTPEQDEFRISVSDTGIGMTPEVQAKIFDRFYQAESTMTRRKGGAGLGLTIAKRIVDMHQGRMEVESEVKRGSCFTIVLPSRRPQVKNGTKA